MFFFCSICLSLSLFVSNSRVALARERFEDSKRGLLRHAPTTTTTTTTPKTKTATNDASTTNADNADDDDGSNGEPMFFLYVSACICIWCKKN